MEESNSLVGQILPKTLAGLVAWLLMFASGAAFSGVLFFFYYRAQIDRVEARVDRFSEAFEKDFEKSKKDFDELVKGAKAEIEKSSGGASAQTNQMTKLLEKAGPSIAQVAGTDAAGAPTLGTGFSVNAVSNETWIITNYRLVAGSAAAKSPVRIRVGATDREGSVWSWDDQRDLALVIIKAGGVPALEWAKDDPTVGSPIWAIGTAPGKLGAAASSGYLLDVSPGGLLTDADVPTHAAGGPVVDRNSKVVGVLSLVYAPEGFPPSNGWAVPIRLSCQRVLRCPS